MMLAVDSVGILFESLQTAGEKIFQDASIEMQPGQFWLQFADPSGNVIDVLGAK